MPENQKHARIVLESTDPYVFSYQLLLHDSEHEASINICTDRHDNPHSAVHELADLMDATAKQLEELEKILYATMADIRVNTKYTIRLTCGKIELAIKSDEDASYRFRGLLSNLALKLRVESETIRKELDKQG